MTSSISTAVFKAIVGMLVRKGRTKRGEGARYGARLVPSRISHQIFFYDFNFPAGLQLSARLQLSYTTSAFFHDFNFPARLTFFNEFNFPARLHLSGTTLTFFTTVTFVHNFNTSTFQHDLNILLS